MTARESVSDFHYLARALIVDDGKVLVAKADGSAVTFLPGGHIEFGERAEDALIREIREEIGQKSTVNGFCGAVEHTWTEEGANFEINLVFNVEVPGISSVEPPASRESQLRFLWLKPEELEANSLQPPPLIGLIRDCSSYGKAYWGSTL